MGKKVSVQDKNVHQLINQAYLAGGEYQWAREGLMNAIQAQSTWVHFGVEEQGFAHSGVARRYIADNGIGMNETELREFMSSFGGGGRPLGMDQNFGQGFKSSCYEWNPYGILVISWSEETPEGRMIWIHREESEHDVFWELKNFVMETDDGVEIEDCILPTMLPDIGVDTSKLKTPEIEEAGHGTVFLFLGDDNTRDTVHGDYLRGEDRIRGIVGYLNKRFIDIPEGVEVRVSSLEAKAKKGTTDRRESKDNYITNDRGERKTIHSRRVTGVRSWIKEEGTQTGVITAKNNTRIKWYLTDQPDLSSDSSYRPNRPMIMVKYEDEAYFSKNEARFYRQFGILNEVRERVWLIIEPPRLRPNSPEWGVTPQASRGMLFAKGGKELPWEEWQDHFAANMPQPIRDAITEVQGASSTDDSEGRKERLKRLSDKLGSRWKPIVLVENKSGRTPGNRANDSGEPRSTSDTRKKTTRAASSGRKKPPSGASGSTVVLDPDESGDAFGSERRKSEGIPEVIWDKDFPSEERQYAARFDSKEHRNGSFGTVHFNVSWPMFQTEFQFWANEYPRASYEEVEAVVKTAYEDEVVSKVMHANKMRNTVVGLDDNGDKIYIDKGMVEEFTSPESLTTAVLGLTNVEQKIRTASGSKFGAANSVKQKSKKNRNEAMDLPA